MRYLIVLHAALVGACVLFRTLVMQQPESQIKTKELNLFSNDASRQADPPYYTVYLHRQPRQWLFNDTETKFSALRRERDCIGLLEEMLHEAHCPARCQYRLRDSSNKNIQ